jgi:hypothetical protein
MSYESRVYAVERFEVGGKVYGLELARFELGTISSYDGNGKRFNELFTVPIDFDLFDGGEVGTRLDCYGEHCKSAGFDTVREWARAALVRDAGFVFLGGFLGWLDAFNVEHFGDVVLVHYGY